MQSGNPSQKADAEAAASALATRLGTGWQPQTYRLLDGLWYPKSVSACGLIEVTQYRSRPDDDGWWAALYASVDSAGDKEFEGFGPTPEDAMSELKHNARRGVARLVRLLKTAGIELDVEDRK